MGFRSTGLDIHKRIINYCVKTADGKIVEEGRKVASKDKLKKLGRGQTAAVGGRDGGDAVHTLGV